MAEETINRADAWKIIDTGIQFDIAFVLADRRRGTGGQYRDLKGVQKVITDTPQLKDVTLRQAQGDNSLKAQGDTRNPNHGLHKTINIHHPGKNRLHIYKLHYRLMHFFNGKRIIN